MSTFGIAEALKSTQWELAKGHLNALVSLQGSYHSIAASEEERWKKLDKAVKSFIKKIEDEGWAE